MKRAPQRPIRAIHLDFHTMPKIYDVGADFNAKHFAQTLADAHINYITIFARCNLGMTYYPTKVGVRHPSLKGDMLGPMVEECHKRSITTVAYINAGLDHEQARLHRDWTVLSKEGHSFTEDKLNNFTSRMCFNTPYGDYMLAMTKEIMDLYPIDGFFYDCIGEPPCYGTECMEAMAAAGMDVLDDEQVAQYAAIRNKRFFERAHKVVGDDKLLFFNGPGFTKQLNEASHLEIECLPSGSWGYETFPTAVRYSRNLGKTIISMTGRFNESWGDFGGLRPQASIEYDCYNAISQGVDCSIGDHMHPRGRLDKAVYDLIGKVYEKVETLEQWTLNNKALTEMAIVAPPKFIVSPSAGANPPVGGAVRMLAELNYQFDIVNDTMSFAPYTILVLPDSVPVTAKLKAKLEKHLAKGGFIISSAYAGLDEDQTAFALDDYKIKYIGPEEFNVSFFEAVRSVAKGLPEMTTTIYEPGVAMKAGKGAKTLAKLIKPYFNRHWDGFHSNMYIPPDKPTNRPALVQCGTVFHFSFPIFAGYQKHAVVAYRQLLANCIASTGYTPLVKAEGLPSFGRVTLTKTQTSVQAHVMNYCPELRGSKLQVIEDSLPAQNVTLTLKLPHAKFAYLAPSKETLDIERNGETITVTIPEVRGYQMVVVE